MFRALSPLLALFCLSAPQAGAETRSFDTVLAQALAQSYDLKFTAVDLKLSQNVVPAACPESIVPGATH